MGIIERTSSAKVKKSRSRLLLGVEWCIMGTDQQNRDGEAGADMPHVAKEPKKHRVPSVLKTTKHSEWYFINAAH